MIQANILETRLDRGYDGPARAALGDSSFLSGLMVDLNCQGTI
jgi:hypothetical protein